MHRHAGHALRALRELSLFFGSIKSTDMGMRSLEKRHLAILFSGALILKLERKVFTSNHEILTHHCDPEQKSLPLEYSQLTFRR